MSLPFNRKVPTCQPQNAELCMGGGVFRTPNNFVASGNPLTILQCFLLTFPIYLFTNKYTKKILEGVGSVQKILTLD